MELIGEQFQAIILHNEFKNAIYPTGQWVYYRQISNISHTPVCYKIIDYCRRCSNCIFVPHIASMELGKTWQLQDETRNIKVLSYIKRLAVGTAQWARDAIITSSQLQHDVADVVLT